MDAYDANDCDRTNLSDRIEVTIVQFCYGDSHINDAYAMISYKFNLLVYFWTLWIFNQEF